jgi:NET1-associated nuclear protein 1 (U3 small nucleolar RNA-associated protein 17)
MASALKRKRGPVEVLDTPKRTKPIKDSQDFLQNPELLHEVGWEATLNPPTKTKELVRTNGTNGDGINLQKNSNHAEAVEFEGFVDEQKTQREEESRRKKKRHSEGSSSSHTWKGPSYVWKLSESIGGRILDVDPVFTEDEKYAAYLLSQECC